MIDEENNSIDISKKKKKTMTPLKEVPGWQYMLLGVVIVLLFALMSIATTNHNQTALVTKNIIHLNNKHTPRVEMYYHPTCGWCKKQFGVMDRYNVRDKFILINTDNNSDLVKKYQIRGTPTFRNTETGHLWTGYINETEFKKFMDYLNMTYTE